MVLIAQDTPPQGGWSVRVDRKELAEVLGMKQRDGGNTMNVAIVAPEKLPYDEWLQKYGHLAGGDSWQGREIGAAHSEAAGYLKTAEPVEDEIRRAAPDPHEEAEGELPELRRRLQELRARLADEAASRPPVGGDAVAGA